MPTFMGVQSAFVSANSKNKELAWELIKYLNTNAMDALITKGNRIPATKAGVESDSFKKLDFMDKFEEQAQYGEPMPNCAEMQAVWAPSRSCITSMISGDLDAKACADQLVDQVKEGISQQN